MKAKKIVFKNALIKKEIKLSNIGAEWVANTKKIQEKTKNIRFDVKTN